MEGQPEPPCKGLMPGPRIRSTDERKELDGGRGQAVGRSRQALNAELKHRQGGRGVGGIKHCRGRGDASSKANFRKKEREA